MGTIKSWINPSIEKIWRENRGLGEAAIRMYRERIQNFLDYCNAKGLSEKAELTLAGAQTFAKWYARRNNVTYHHTFEIIRSALGTWSHARRTLGEGLPCWNSTPKPLPTLPPLVEEFSEHVRRHRGNPPRTIRAKAYKVVRFLAFLRSRGRCVTRLRISDIDAFIMQLRPRYSRTVVSDYCSSLRGFARFLHATGRLPADLAPWIVSPKVLRAERPYRTLPWGDVKRILQAVDHEARGGRRDYALLLMMSMYGLGAGEVACLKLENIDWSAGKIHLERPKTGPRRPCRTPPPVAGSNSSTWPVADGWDDYAARDRLASRSAASLSRQLFPSNFSRCPRCITRSSNGVTTTTSPRSFGQSSMGLLEVITVDSFS